MSSGADKCVLRLVKPSSGSQTKGRLLSRKFAMTVALDYFASSTMAKYNGCSGHNF